ncbi:hypothetical protein GIB67_033283 [Kingdonia uniflora]|uniref:RNase H type-1 domain-containing protein n=1 Tax=Kingdonia uniflora TaxID=39325 RepID=A0A7J7LJP6_9MAGN|nr:hypothetical protein GIB67_033283 [Kingdonia uniflora]
MDLLQNRVVMGLFSELMKGELLLLARGEFILKTLLHELQAVMQGLIFVIDSGEKRVRIRCDSKFSVDIIHGISEPPWAARSIVRFIHKALQLMDEWWLEYTFRETNRAPDHISKLALPYVILTWMSTTLARSYCKS